MNLTQKYLIKVNLAVLIYMTIAIWFFGINTTTAVSFLVSYFVIYLVSYNCFHRVWAHRQFQLKKPFDRIIAFCGLFVMVGDAISYARTHRYHHRWSDTENDVHSPIHGFWHSSFGWMMKKQPEVPLTTIKDLLTESYLQFYMRYQISLVWLTIAALMLISPHACIGLLLAMCTTYILEMLSNSVFNHDPKIPSAINNKWYAWISLSTYHLDHHTTPSIVHKNDPGRVLVWFLTKIGAIK